MDVPNITGLSEFLRDYPRMALKSESKVITVIEGMFDFSAVYQNMPEVTDSFAISIKVPAKFPCELPIVMEFGGRIPNDGRHHLNRKDGTLCLGTPIRLMWILSKKPTLAGFAENCLVPYLYAMSQTLNGESHFAFGELPHGGTGEFIDYANMLNLKEPEQAKRAIALLGLKKRIANKQPCPCGCGKLLGKCSFNLRLHTFRKIASQSWYKSITEH